jgi:hypothetical protein
MSNRLVSSAAYPFLAAIVSPPLCSCDEHPVFAVLASHHGAAVSFLCCCALMLEAVQQLRFWGNKRMANGSPRRVWSFHHHSETLHSLPCR